MENFGDRLGYHTLNGVLPPSAVVSYCHFYPWNVPSAEYIDILIIGIGNSIFEPLLQEHVIRLVERVPCAIGIFGTQYRKSLNRDNLKRLMKPLYSWHARSLEDIELFGDFNHNVRHLGDWLVDSFPIATPVLKDELNIASRMAAMVSGNTPLSHAPLDRVIQFVQQYERVWSPKLHLLLCALTSANAVAYSEQRDFGFNEVSGKFNSLLNDVFGRHFPENRYFDVDRQKVVDYKLKVRKNIIELGGVIREAAAKI